MEKMSVAFCALLVASAAGAEEVLVKSGDATISAIVEKPAGKSGRQPAVLVFDIYTNPEAHARHAKDIAARGFVAVIADTRGKGRSPDAIVPYEHDGEDARAVIEWIARQPWSDGKVGMIGGSYSGFTAWAAAKRKPRALKGIAVSAAAIPGHGLPMHNNVFLSANYGWAFFVTNNKRLDDAVYSDPARWNKMTREWFMSGRPYRELDAVDGTPNPWFQRWLRHPAFDAYWQRMAPFGKDYARIDIPVLTITGYYDDGQVSALRYMTEQLKHRPKAEHYLLIGPWDHFGTHASTRPDTLREYRVDPVSNVDSLKLKLDFMDHVLNGAARPTQLVDRVNYQLMGDDTWRSARSLEAMNTPRRLYLASQAGGATLPLTDAKPPDGCVTHEVDLADRVKFHGFHAYPYPIVQGPLQYVTEAIFESGPFDRATVISGTFRGTLLTRINKRDFDYTVTVYEAMPDGKLFHLGYSLNRASHATDGTKRNLLTPGELTGLPFETSLVARKMRPGSALLVLVDAVKHPSAQINYGTGKNVSDESVKDAGEPLRIEWCAGSFVDVPVGS
jgi:putative CocE/NonD family hydrolase